LSVPPSEAAAYWREVVRQLCVRLGIEPTPGTAFCGEISRRAYGDFSLAVSRASGGMWCRTRGDIARGGGRGRVPVRNGPDPGAGGA